MLKLKVKPGEFAAFEEELDSRQDFIADMLDDFPKFDDSWKVLEVTEDDKKIDFTGNIEELYKYFVEN